MYAIRSYYEEGALNHTRTQAELLAEKEALQNQAETLLQRIGADRERLSANQRLAREFEDRITSYNVCYTKLLRVTF